ncbi:MAG: hypothetical protein K9K37_12405 [Desulfocapsa sp.]|nr:hypothetical protein [Desulfocapsa sp.]
MKESAPDLTIFGKARQEEDSDLDQLAKLNDRVYRAMLLKEQFHEVYRAGSDKASQTGLR